ncbi:hypothetical protein BH10CYA1_BH10CYA1_06030 [soil metagenome]
MIYASIKMGWQDKRLLLPSVLTVFTNFFFAIVLMIEAKQKLGGTGAGVAHQLAAAPHELMNQAKHGEMLAMSGLNGSMDQSGFNALGSIMGSETTFLVTCIVSVWWLTNRFLEGVTTALVYSHLTEGPGSGKFSTACQAVLTSLPAIVMLGAVTLVAKKLAGWMRDKRGTGIFGFGMNFLAGIVEVFWTLAGHLILPSIVIEGTSFWGALKRADKIAQGNLLTIGVGEVGVDLICRSVSGIVYVIGMAAFGGTWYMNSQGMAAVSGPVIIVAGLAWASLVVLVTAMSLYIRASFYTCLYVWAIEAESVEETERSSISAPAPLAAALA